MPTMLLFINNRRLISVKTDNVVRLISLDFMDGHLIEYTLYTHVDTQLIQARPTPATTPAVTEQHADCSLHHIQLGTVYPRVYLWFYGYFLIVVLIFSVYYTVVVQYAYAINSVSLAMELGCAS
jgi:hypothetical protein